MKKSQALAQLETVLQAGSQGIARLMAAAQTPNQLVALRVGTKPNGDALALVFGLVLIDERYLKNVLQRMEAAMTVIVGFSPQDVVDYEQEQNLLDPEDE